MPTDPDLSRAVWRKSSYSNGQGGACMEVVTSLAGLVGVRDSKDRDGACLVFTDEEWQGFINAVRAEL